MVLIQHTIVIDKPSLVPAWAPIWTNHSAACIH